MGRREQIDRILTRGVRQVTEGKPIAMFVQGEYGIGKSSIAAFVQRLAEKDHGLHGIHVSLGGARELLDVAASVLEATLNSGAMDRSRSERVRGWIERYLDWLQSLEKAPAARTRANARRT